jgi:hypothetical protein
MGFGAAPVCSETFTMAEDPKAFCCWGKKQTTKINETKKSETINKNSLTKNKCIWWFPEMGKFRK